MGANTRVNVGDVRRPSAFRLELGLCATSSEQSRSSDDARSVQLIELRVKDTPVRAKHGKLCLIQVSLEPVITVIKLHAQLWLITSDEPVILIDDAKERTKLLV